MTEFILSHCNCNIRTKGGTQYGAGVAIYPRRYIHRDNRLTRAVDGGNYLRQLPLYGALEARAQQRVHNQAARREGML